MAKIHPLVVDFLKGTNQMNAKVVIESGNNGDLKYLALRINGTIFRMSVTDYQSFRGQHNGLSPEQFIANLAEEITYAVDGRT